MTFSEKCLYCLLVDLVRSTYAKLADLDFINKKVIELIFKLNIPRKVAQHWIPGWDSNRKDVYRPILY